MFGSNHRKQIPGKYISAKQLNQHGPTIDRHAKLRAAGGMGSFSSPFGASLQFNQINVAFASTPSEGIAAATSNSISSATCNVMSMIDNGDSTATPTSHNDTIDVFNLSQQAVNGSTNIIAMRIDSIWVCIWEDCGP